MEKRSRAILTRHGGVNGAERPLVRVASKGELRWGRGAESVNLPAGAPDVTATSKPWLDRRGAKRFPARLCSAKVLDGRFKYRCDCLIRDESATGLRLLLIKRVRLPRHFTLYDDQTKDVIRVAVVWQRGHVVGVKILSKNDDLLMTPAQRYALGGLYFGMRDD